MDPVLEAFVDPPLEVVSDEVFELSFLSFLDFLPNTLFNIPVFSTFSAGWFSGLYNVLRFDAEMLLTY